MTKKLKKSIEYSPICQIKDCTRPVHIKKHCLCQSHYLRLVRYGDVYAHIPIEKRTVIKAFKHE
jgi:hypothetical protein